MLNWIWRNTELKASASATSSSSFLNHNAYKEKLVKLSLLAFINHVVLTPSFGPCARAQKAKTLKHDWEEGRTENSLLHKDGFWKKLIQWQPYFSKAITLNYIHRGMLCLASLLQSAKIWLSKWIFYVKSYSNLSDFFSLRNKILEVYFLLKWLFGNFNFKTTFLLKSGRFFTRLQS